MDQIKLAINHQKLADQGWSFDDWSDIYSYISELVDWLESHNKNYTKEQYHKIISIKEILDCIDYGA